MNGKHFSFSIIWGRRWMRKVIIFLQWIITWYYRPRIASLRPYSRKVFHSFQGRCSQKSINVKFMEICSLIKKVSHQQWLYYPRNSGNKIFAFKDSLQIPQFTLYFFQYLIEVQNFVINEFIWSIYITFVDYLFCIWVKYFAILHFSSYLGIFWRTPRLVILSQETTR